VCPIASQDSSLMAPLATADCLVVRPPGAPALPAGASVDTLPLDF
ncbi:MAG: molybdopterin molybdenumtransferase MoeA, partial [Hyphomicrobiaceae bacterium]|nr:molybdopterin molybdenumtransferase MoeA [Hyphomicrobiaceae bacterium]